MSPTGTARGPSSDKVQRAQLALAFWKPPGQHQGMAIFRNLAGLDDDAQVPSAVRPSW